MMMTNPSLDQLLANNLALVPCLKNKKNNLDSDILTKLYSNEEVKGGDNVALNLGLSNLVDFDGDSEAGIKVLNKVLGHTPEDVSTIIRYDADNEHDSGVTTHYISTKDPNINFDGLNLERKDLNGKPIIELLYKGILMIPPSKTFQKDNPKKLWNRKWGRFYSKPKIIKNIVDQFNWMSFAAFIYPLIKSTNTGMLKLDACLKRYTDATDNERFSFLKTVYDLAYPGEWEVNRDLKTAPLCRVIKSNNNEKSKTAGYKALAEHFGIDPIHLKERINWVGKVPEDIDGKQGKKTVVDFYENSLDIKQILQTDFPPVNWVVRDVLPEGFGLLAGRPKAMKSWTALDLVYKCQNGLVFLDKETVGGDCLYLALEDNARRLKDRITKLGYDKKQFQHPTILTEAPYLNQGLEESIQLWTEQVTNPKLVVIDTLAKVKKTYGRNNNTAYDKDSEMLRDIQKIAMKLNITILAISHLGKNNFDYDWDRIQGSTGMQGISDFFWMLDRGDNGDTAFIKGRGRDMEDFEYGLKWDNQTWRYEFEGTLTAVLMSNSKKEIIEAMQQIGKEEVQPKEVCTHLGYKKQKDVQRIQKTMSRMRDKLELDFGSGTGFYSLPKDLRPKKSEINYELDKVN